MPRRRVTEEPAIKDESLPGLDLPPDPQPTTRRGPGRPRGSTTTTKKAPPKMARGSDGRVMSKAALKNQVATELYGFATLFVGMWSLRDPQCASTFTDEVRMPDGTSQERLAAIVGQTVEILGRNDKVLAAMATSGMIGQVGMLASLLWPVGKEIWQAHGPGGHGHRDQSEQSMDYAQYPAPALA